MANAGSGDGHANNGALAQGNAVEAVTKPEEEDPQ
jgi:hypothetical protein